MFWRLDHARPPASIWKFPEGWVPLNHPFQWDFPLKNYRFGGTPRDYGNHHIEFPFFLANPHSKSLWCCQQLPAGRNQVSLSALALSMAVLTNLRTVKGGLYQQMMIDNNK